VKKHGLPKWAKALTARQWRALCKCQRTKRPTLVALKEDVAYQKEHGLVCHDCAAALAAVERATIPKPRLDFMRR